VSIQNAGELEVFLEYFGLHGLEDLPAADELRHIPVTKAEGLLTADPGLATIPPEQLTLADVEAAAPPSAAPPEAPPVQTRFNNEPVLVQLSGRCSEVCGLAWVLWASGLVTQERGGGLRVFFKLANGGSAHVRCSGK
jgi:hypothetical protein